MSASTPPSNAPSTSSLLTSSNAHTSVSPAEPHFAHHQASGSATGRRGSLSLIGSANAARVRLTQDVSISTRLVHCQTPVPNTCWLLLHPLSFALSSARTAPAPQTATTNATADTREHRLSRCVSAQPLFQDSLNIPFLQRITVCSRRKVALQALDEEIYPHMPLCCPGL